MQKDQTYHESAIAYNEGLAEFAENLVPTLEHEEVRRWCAAVGKQHRFHAKQHRSALNKFLLRQIPPPVEVFLDGLDVPPLEGTMTAEATVTSTEAEEKTPEEILTPHQTAAVLEDGCSPYHDPTNPTCEFSVPGGSNG